jgi:hypothetical protein
MGKLLTQKSKAYASIRWTSSVPTRACHNTGNHEAQAFTMKDENGRHPEVALFPAGEGSLQNLSGREILRCA